MSCSRYLCQWSIKHARPFFGQQDIRNEKSAHVRDFEKKKKKKICLLGIYAVVSQVTLRLKEIILIFIA